jgi:hypothetical protein
MKILVPYLILSYIRETVSLKTVTLNVIQEPDDFFYEVHS